MTPGPALGDGTPDGHGGGSSGGLGSRRPAAAIARGAALSSLTLRRALASRMLIRLGGLGTLPRQPPVGRTTSSSPLSDSHGHGGLTWQPASDPECGAGAGRRAPRQAYRDVTVTAKVLGRGPGPPRAVTVAVTVPGLSGAGPPAGRRAAGQLGLKVLLASGCARARPSDLRSGLSRELEGPGGLQGLPSLPNRRRIHAPAFRCSGATTGRRAQ